MDWTVGGARRPRNPTAGGVDGPAAHRPGATRPGHAVDRRLACDHRRPTPPRPAVPRRLVSGWFTAASTANTRRRPSVLPDARHPGGDG